MAKRVKRNCSSELLKLNDDCLLEIFKYLEWKDSRRLGRTCVRLQKLAHVRCHNILFEFNSKMMKKGNGFIDSILPEIGEHIRSWELTIESVRFGKRLLTKVGQHCSNLKILKVVKLHTPGQMLFCPEAVDCFENVQYLHCKLSDLSGATAFFASFRRLKNVCFCCCGIRSEDMQVIFKNNPIETIYLCGLEERFLLSDFQLCQFGSNFGALGIGTHRRLLQMDSLLRLATTNLTNLTKLSLSTGTNNLGNFLTALAKRGVLEELELGGVQLDRNSFNVLQLFKKLKRLIFFPDNLPQLKYELDSTLIWPPNLKYLRLNLPVKIEGFISTIQQLKHLSRFGFESSKMSVECLKKLCSVDEMARLILNENDKRILSINMPLNVICTVDADGIKIYRTKYDPISINWPTFDPQCRKRLY